VAVIDTGIDFQHPDLNVVGGVNCTGSILRPTCVAGGDDDHYHGTHVAGIIGALDNDIGVVGVAPGARLWAVKVLNKNGSGWSSWIIAGIDWVAANANTIAVANMSLGGSGYSQPSTTPSRALSTRGWPLPWPPAIPTTMPATTAHPPSTTSSPSVRWLISMAYQAVVPAPPVALTRMIPWPISATGAGC